MTLALPALCLLLAPATPDEAARLLSRTRDLLAGMANRMSNFTCTQHIVRTQFNASTPKRDNCGAPFIQKSPSMRDRVRLEVARLNGREIFAWRDGPRFESDNPDELLGGGVSASGDFGSFLVGIFLNRGTLLSFIRGFEQDGVPLLEYSYEVPITSSHYYVAISSGRLLMAYEGTFWLHRDTGSVVRLVVNAPHPPALMGACRVTSTIDLQPLTLESETFLVPRTTRLEVYETQGNSSVNETTYGSCRAFRAESTIRFEPPPNPESATSAAPPELPRGTVLRLELEHPVDTDRTWTGDSVIGVLASPVHDSANRALLPRGTRFNGRILRLQHITAGRRSNVVLGFGFESFEWQGTAIPVRLTPATARDRRPKSSGLAERPILQVLPREPRTRVYQFTKVDTGGSITFKRLKSEWAVE